MSKPSLPLSKTRLPPPAAALVAAGAISSQCGAALATKVIGQAGSAGAVTLRLVFAALALAVLVRPWRRGVRGLLRRSRRADLAVVVLFGAVLAGMNLSFYESIARIPLGVAVTVEFVGPLAVAVAGSRRWAHALCALLAAAGVLLLAGGSLFGVVHHLDIGGVGFAALAGCFWAAYILLNQETGKRFSGTTGLAGAMAIGALLVAPIGAAEAGAALVRPSVVGLGAAVALLSSAIPYSFEMAALRRATPRAFGILLSMAPALGALAGLVILGQRLSGLEVGAVVLVVAANVGSAWLGTGTRAVPGGSPVVTDSITAGAPGSTATPAPDSTAAGAPDSTAADAPDITAADAPGSTATPAPDITAADAPDITAAPDAAAPPLSPAGSAASRPTRSVTAPP